MSVKFGTSGLRGLVTAMTPALIASHVRAFVAACDTGGVILVGQDLRDSSPRMAQDVIAAGLAAGCDMVDCGAVPTPALALAAATANAGAVMVTGSHIPADRNGLKFYSRQGEITKADEAAILSHLTQTPPAPQDRTPKSETHTDVNTRFVARYVDAYGAQALAGLRIGVYAHSAVGRDVLADLLAGLGAQVVPLGRSETFIPVDTEAVSPEMRARIAAWVSAHRLDALVSTDGDSDRPLLADATGQVVPGDLLGQITAQALGAEVVVTPISSNSGITRKGLRAVHLTRIGSPFVIAGMEAATGRVVGYEANGGFLLGFAAQGPAGPIAPLMTRDCMLPLVAVLHAARDHGVAARVAAEPAVVTLAGRLQDIAQDKSAPLLSQMTQDADLRGQFLAGLGLVEARHDLTDGLRMIADSGAVVHIRPSGNAPELRVYVESEDADTADRLLAAALAALARRLA